METCTDRWVKRVRTRVSSARTGMHAVLGEGAYAPINNIAQVTKDPQILHNQMIVSTPHELLGEVEVTGVPIKFHGTPGSVRLAPPMLGQHTAEVLAEVGYSESEVEEMAAGGLVGLGDDVKKN